VGSSTAGHKVRKKSHDLYSKNEVTMWLTGGVSPIKKIAIFSALFSSHFWVF